MRTLFRLTVLSVATLALGFAAFAQGNTQIEKELIGHVKLLKKWSAYGPNSDFDKLSKANETFKNKLLKYGKLSSTLKYNFPKFGREIFISTSADGKFRIYSWDTEEGGTMHSFENVYQYMGQDGRVYSKSYPSEEGDAGAFVSDIYALTTGSGPVYMARFSAILSTVDAYQSIDLFRIRGNLLDNRVKLIKTKEGLTHTLGFEYDFFSVVDRKERPIKLITYDAATRSIKLPVVIVDDKNRLGRVTNKFITYRFNGTYFVKVR
jgi:hypothetical protein